MKRSYLSKLSKLLLTGIFFVFIFIPPVKTLVTPRPVWSQVEKRRLAELPEIHVNWQAVESIPPQFEAFYNDHFGFRERLIKRYNSYMRKYFGKTASRKVLIGKNHWLYLTDGELIEDYISVDPLSPEELERWKINLESKHRWLKERGIRYLFVIAPNKQSIYPENMPDYLQRKRGRSRMDQLLAYLAENSEVSVLDLRPHLIEAKQKAKIYYRTDTHWNPHGAYIAHKAIMDVVYKWFPDKRPPDLQFKVSSKGPKWQTDLATMAQLEEDLLEIHEKVRFESKCARRQPFELNKAVAPNQKTIYTTCNRANLKAVVFRDSFSNALQPFISESFKEVVLVWNPYDHSIMLELLEKMDPDIVIEEMVERYLILIRAENKHFPVNPIAQVQSETN